MKELREITSTVVELGQISMLGALIFLPLPRKFPKKAPPLTFLKKTKWAPLSIKQAFKNVGPTSHRPIFVYFGHMAFKINDNFRLTID